MKIYCTYCGNPMNDYDETCDKCGAANQHLRRTSPDQPTTIEELKEWYKEHNLPGEDITRFFIGKNYSGARAFGIYHDGGKFVVYKNKNDGTRVIRYEGNDEAYAVNEIYQKLREEMINQKEIAARSSNDSSTNNSNYYRSQYTTDKRSGGGLDSTAVAYIVFTVFVILILAVFVSFTSGSGKSSGSSYHHTSYYYDDDDYDYDSYRYNKSSNSYDSSSWNSYDSWDSWNSGGTDWDSDW